MRIGLRVVDAACLDAASTRHALRCQTKPDQTAVASLARDFRTFCGDWLRLPGRAAPYPSNVADAPLLAALPVSNFFRLVCTPQSKIPSYHYTQGV